MTGSRGETDLARLLVSLDPRLMAPEYAICCLDSWRWQDLERLEPLALFREQEGLTLVVERRAAERAGLAAGPLFRVISLSPHSSLEAVGLTAAVAAALASRGIPANTFAGYFHDHLLVPSHRAGEALQALRELAA